MDNEFERAWKEAVLAKFDVLSLHLPGITEETHKRSRCPCRDLIGSSRKQIRSVYSRANLLGSSCFKLRGTDMHTDLTFSKLSSEELHYISVDP
jgi:hypothetical protein